MNAALVYALVAAGANLAGGLVITMASPRGRLSQRLLIGFGAGFMLAVAFLAMIPHAMEEGASAAAGILAGYLLVHLTQHVFVRHFHFGEETHGHEMVGRWIGIAALLGLLLHTFFDGVAIASGFGVSTELGLLIFTGILLHKIPEGVTIYVAASNLIPEVQKERGMRFAASVFLGVALYYVAHTLLGGA